MARPSKVNTGVATSDGAIKAGPGKVYWMNVATGDTGGAYQLDDTDGSGTVRFSGVAGANTEDFKYFDPPIEFDVAIFADIQGSNVTLTVGYV